MPATPLWEVKGSPRVEAEDPLREGVASAHLWLSGIAAVTHKRRGWVAVGQTEAEGRLHPRYKESLVLPLNLSRLVKFMVSMHANTPGATFPPRGHGL